MQCKISLFSVLQGDFTLMHFIEKTAGGRAGDRDQPRAPSTRNLLRLKLWWHVRHTPSQVWIKGGFQHISVTNIVDEKELGKPERSMLFQQATPPQHELIQRGTVWKQVPSRLCTGPSRHYGNFSVTEMPNILSACNTLLTRMWSKNGEHMGNGFFQTTLCSAFFQSQM